MRGSAVPTMVWSRAARNRPSAIPMVTKTVRRRPSVSTDMRSLLVGGLRERLLKVGQRGGETVPLLGGEGRQDLGDGLGHVLADALDLTPAARGHFDDHHAPVRWVLRAAHEAVALERVDELRERGPRQHAFLREVAAPAPDVGQLPEDARALEADGPALVRDVRGEAADPRQER